MRRRNINSTKQKILKIEREKPDNAPRQLFSPSHDLMRRRKISFNLPNAFAVFGAIDGTTRVSDYLKGSLVSDLKLVSDQRCFEIATVERDFLGVQVRQWRLRGKRLITINGHQGQRIGRALRVDG